MAENENKDKTLTEFEVMKEIHDMISNKSKMDMERIKKHFGHIDYIKPQQHDQKQARSTIPRKNDVTLRGTDDLISMSSSRSYRGDGCAAVESPTKLAASKKASFIMKSGEVTDNNKIRKNADSEYIRKYIREKNLNDLFKGTWVT